MGERLAFWYSRSLIQLIEDCDLPSQSSLGREMRRLRAASGLTLAEVSARTAVREAYLTAIEEDREEPSAAALRRLAHELEPAGASYEYLASFLTGPEFNVSGEYATSGDARAGMPARTTDASTSSPPLTSIPVASHAPQDTRIEGEELQFDRAVTELASPAATVAVICWACGESIDTEYYEVNGRVVCSRCRAAAESAAETPREIGTLVVAGAFGVGAAVAGAIVYNGVLTIAHLEIGIVAILIGYMVGYAVRRGARGRGGRRFQVLAVLLTYASVALAYTPVAFNAMNRPTQTAATTNNRTADARVATAKPSGGKLLLALLAMLAFVCLLPVVVVFGSFPSGLISGFIIFIGMRQAWKMTGAPSFQVLGPYRVGPAAVAGPA